MIGTGIKKKEWMIFHKLLEHSLYCTKDEPGNAKHWTTKWTKSCTLVIIITIVLPSYFSYKLSTALYGGNVAKRVLDINIITSQNNY